MSLATKLYRVADSASSIQRACGAIALVTVMNRWGVESSLLATWPCVARPDPFGTSSAKSYRLAAYASDQGLQAVALKCRADRAWDALLQCTRLGLSVIINHQARAARDEGHYSILVSISKDRIITDDPISQAHDDWSREEFLDHWNENVEITGNVLVAIGGRPHEPRGISSNRCPSCSARLCFEPSELFEPKDWKTGGLWQAFYCPGCDASFGVGL